MFFRHTKKILRVNSMSKKRRKKILIRVILFDNMTDHQPKKKKTKTKKNKRENAEEKIKMQK